MKLQNVFTHWKTTLLGAAAAALNVILNGRDGKSLATSILIAIVGAMSQDK